MTDAPPSSGPSVGDLAARIDELVREVRRQGRAAVAAQAAAEACLAVLEADADASSESVDPRPRDVVPGDATRWLEAIVPVADALDRVAAHAAALAARPEPPAKRWLGLFGPVAPSGAEMRALVEGIAVLRAQLATALSALGVTADRRVGVPIDPVAHRVMEVRPCRPGEREGAVVEVVRPGYAIGERMVREAEVVASAQAPARR